MTLFSATYCRYCTIAKKTLDDIGTSYTAVELDKMASGEGGQLAMGLREVTGEGTVPQASMFELETAQFSVFLCMYDCTYLVKLELVNFSIIG